MCSTNGVIIEEDGNCLQYSRDDGSRGCGGVTAVYTRSDRLLVLRYWSLGDRSIEIHTVLEEDETRKTIRLATMAFKYEEYDEWASGSIETYDLYRGKCCITTHIVEDFVADVFGTDWSVCHSR